MADTNLIVKVRLILTQNDKILLLGQTKSNGGKYTLIGGHVEQEEFPKKALIRESFEETGIKLKADNLHLVHVSNTRPGNRKCVTMFFQGENWEGSFVMKEPHKFKKVKWFPTKKLPENATKTVKQVVKHYLSNTAYSEFR